MGNAYLWWYPSPSGTLEAIDLGTNVSDIQEDPDPLVEGIESVGGAQSRIAYRGRYRVRITLERIAGTSTTGRALQRSLWSLQTHLDTGGFVAFARDRDQAWAGFTFPSPGRASSTIVCVGAATGGAFPYHGNATLSAGSEIVVQACAPEVHQRELLLVSSFSSTATITLDTQTTRYDWSALGPAMVRHRDFYPVLRQPLDKVGEPVVLSDRRIGYTLDMTLIEDMATIEQVRAFGPGWLAGSTEARGSMTLEQALSVASGITLGQNVTGSAKRGLR